ncbi:hypothetical protein DES40_1711 [Litorimonas taeanensis]|uniref:Uncharacterized protein n=1 Tax=Litorimonas taeanensis TaxID=568099 RepID=A0A420WDA4_9PROT|nr:hypothetical protein [Litorimonas taeanensis]RKQ68935.1 hypothetical protein DES40_1711 [Litorimonas taeanensis]
MSSNLSGHKSGFRWPTLSEALITALATIVVAAGTFIGGSVKDITEERDSQREARYVAERDLYSLRTLFGAVLAKAPEDITILEMRTALNDNLVSLAELKQLVKSARAFIWIKKRIVLSDGSVRYVMVQCSDYYALHLLSRSAQFYVGKTDAEVYDTKTAAEFFKADEKAWRDGYVDNLEYSFYSRLTDKQYVFEGAKWRFAANDNDYVAGLGEITEISAPK